MRPQPTIFAAWRRGALAFVLVLLSPAPLGAQGAPTAARAPEELQCDPMTVAADPLYLWGFEEGCDADGQAARDAVSEIEIAHQRHVRVLRRPPTNRTGGGAASYVAALRQFRGCESQFRHGTVLGGRIERLPHGGPGSPRIQVWRYDLDTDKLWLHELDARLCTDGVCGNGRFADQELKRLRPEQRAAIALGLLMQARVDNDFQSCVPGCQAEGARKVARGSAFADAACRPMAPLLCAASTSQAAVLLQRLSLRPDASPPPARSASLRLAKGWLAASFALSAAALIALAVANGSPAGTYPMACTMPQSAACKSGYIESALNSAVWVAGGATALTGLGLATTLIYDRATSRPSSGQAERPEREERSAPQGPDAEPICWLLGD
jgi:hypothetical protein